MDIAFDGQLQDGGYKLDTGGDIITLSNLATDGAFTLSGQMLASNNNCYPHIGDGYESGKFNIFFDFQEGFSQLSINGRPVYEWKFGPRSGTLDWFEPTSFETWHTWSLTYDGVASWGLTINSINLPASNIYDPVVFSVIDFDLIIYNYPTFGNGYILIKDLILS